MSGDHAKKEMVTGDKPAISHGKTPSGESRNKGKDKESSSQKSHRSGDKKKKMRKVVYYATDSSSPSTSGSDAPSITSKRHERKKYSKMPVRYPRISKRTPLLSVPLGKPPMFEGEDYSMWSDKMRHHLTSLTKAYGILLSMERMYQRRGTRIMIRRRSNKSNTSNPKPLLYSSPL